MSPTRRVVMTGAAGLIGRAVTPMLAPRWDLALTDLSPGVGDVLDVTDADACRAAFARADAVIHLAGIPDPNASWEALLPANVIGVHQVAQAAMDCGVRRLVLASSLQAVSAYPPGTQVRTADPPRPANLYGATKAWAEAVGAWVVSASATSVVALRLGYFAHQPPAGTEATARNLAAWLSPRDCAELLRSAVEADGLSFVVANGVSANRYQAAELSDSAQRIGYRPTDDAWSHG
ncbi:MAG: NAD(P)-dependent oxidoreductase [Actinomycetota bacterium]|nr:NAD(P)-dependent oxidoreductase [Actinomycetota bacterium]